MFDCYVNSDTEYLLFEQFIFFNYLQLISSKFYYFKIKKIIIFSTKLYVK